MEAAARKGLGRGCTAKMNDRGELVLLLLVGGPVWSACENRRNLAVQKHRCELDSVARHDASIKPIEPAAFLHDSVVADAISSCFGEGCVGHLVHADGARGGLIDRERIPSQAPPPIRSCYRIARPSTCARAASSSGVMLAVEYFRKSGAYCCQVSTGILFIAPLTAKSISVGLRTT